MHTNTVLVSIVTPTYNSDHFIAETLASVNGQSYPNIEHIIVDGGSHDNTLLILREYQKSTSNIVSVISEPDDGMYDAINKGLSIAKGEILTYLNSDDLYDGSNVIDKIVHVFGKDGGIKWIYSNVKIINGHSQIVANYRIPPFNWKTFACASWSFIPQPTTFWRKELFEEIGGFNKNYQMAADFDFFLKAGMLSTPKRVDFVVARFREHDDALTSKQQDLSKAEMKAIIEEHNLEDLSFYSLYRLLSWLQFKAWNLDTYVCRGWRWIRRYSYTRQ